MMIRILILMNVVLCKRQLLLEAETEEAGFTHSTALLYCAKGECIIFCSGTLITPNVVLTAAHCLRPVQTQWKHKELTFPLDEVKVIVGTNDGKDLSKAVGVLNVTTHSFGENRFFPSDGDLALIELDRCVDVYGMPFPKIATGRVSAEDCVMVEVSAFGKYRNIHNLFHSSSELLRVAQFHLHTDDVCRNSNADASLFSRGYKPGNIVEEEHARFALQSYDPRVFICFGGNVKPSVCNGDSGAGVFTVRGKKLIGVVSFAASGFCGLAPTIASKIAPYSEWIFDRLKEFANCEGFNVHSVFDGEVFSDLENVDGRCPSKMFQCQFNAVCILDSKVCDGVSDCHDGSDESLATCGVLDQRSTTAQDSAVCHDIVIPALDNLTSTCRSEFQLGLRGLKSKSHAFASFACTQLDVCVQNSSVDIQKIMEHGEYCAKQPDVSKVSALGHRILRTCMEIIDIEKHERRRMDYVAAFNASYAVDYCT